MDLHMQPRDVGDKPHIDGVLRLGAGHGACHTRDPIFNNDHCSGSEAPATNGARVIVLKNKPRRKVYTRTGDRGRCSLLSGERAMEYADQVEASGDIDELNSILGVLLVAAPKKALGLSAEIEDIQHTLFLIGALVAAGPDFGVLKHLEPISPVHIQALERSIDAMEDRLPVIRRFIIPGGHASAAFAHLARSVCRRAERRVLKSLRNFNSSELPETIGCVLAYLNRLSDYLFVLGRLCNVLQNTPEKCIGSPAESFNP